VVATGRHHDLVTARDAVGAAYRAVVSRTEADAAPDAPAAHAPAPTATTGTARADGPAAPGPAAPDPTTGTIPRPAHDGTTEEVRA
jgi:hypothetical protein